MVLIASRTHPSTTANIALNTEKISFRTNASHILGPSDEEQLLVSGIDSLRIQLSIKQIITIGGAAMQAASLEIEGGPSASCSFYQVRSSILELSGPSLLTLGASSASGERSFNLKAHGSLSGNLTSRPGDADAKPGFTCTRVSVNGAPAVDVEGNLSPHGGDSIFFSTASDARLDFIFAAHSEIGDTQIPILGELRFSEIDPRTAEEKSVLRKPPPEVVFEKLEKKVTLDDADLLVVVPKSDFYLRQFMVKDGIHLSLHGVVADVRAGAGVSDLETLMPSSFDHLDNLKRIYGVIPALVVLILGVLEKMGGLPKK